MNTPGTLAELRGTEATIRSKPQRKSNSPSASAMRIPTLTYRKKHGTDIDALIQNNAVPREVSIVDIKRAFDNYTWEAWSDGVMRIGPCVGACRAQLKSRSCIAQSDEAGVVLYYCGPRASRN